MRFWDTHTRRLLWERTIEDAFNLRGLAFTPDGQSLVCAHSVRREFPVSRDNIEEGWVIDSRLTRFALQAGRRADSWQIALDTRGQAVGDPDGIAFSPAADCSLSPPPARTSCCCSKPALPWNAGDRATSSTPAWQPASTVCRSGGRPVAVAFAKRAGRSSSPITCSTPCRSSMSAGKWSAPSRLGGPAAKPRSPGRGPVLRREPLTNQWFSCHTCHIDGHTCGLNFDTLNDDSYGNPKLTPTLRSVAKTGPWTWHGWQKDLGAAAEKSLTETMFGPDRGRARSKALVAFLETLEQPPNPSAEPEPRRPARTVPVSRQGGCAAATRARITRREAPTT